MSQSLTIATFNVRQMPANDGPNHWDLRRHLLTSVVRDLDADILGTQEPFADQVDVISAALPEHRLVGVGRADGVRGGEWSAIFVREERLAVVESGNFWFSMTPDVAGSRGWDATYHPRLCTWALLADRRTGRDMLVYNSHWDNAGVEARQRSAAMLAERVAQRPSGVAAVVIGDFNSRPDSAAIRYLLGTGALDIPAGEYTPSQHLRDSWELADHADRQEGTFHGFGGDADGPRIDYILVTPEIRVLSSEIVRTNEGGRYPSDHFPLRAVIEVKQPD